MFYDQITPFLSLQSFIVFSMTNSEYDERCKIDEAKWSKLSKKWTERKCGNVVDFAIAIIENMPDGQVTKKYLMKKYIFDSKNKLY